MRDLILKVQILWWFLTGAYENWRQEIKGRDLDSLYCCDGRECGCQAATVRDVYVSAFRPATNKHHGVNHAE